jgi:hypothetical protein
MLKLGYIFEDVQFIPQINFTARAICADSDPYSEEGSSAEAGKGSQCNQGSREGVGFFDPSAMAAGRSVMHSIAERAFIAYCKANDTSLAQLASGVSGDDIGGCKRKGNATG